jgi:hypothetical protein
MTPRRLRIVAFVLGAMLLPAPAWAQDDGSRTYQLLPDGSRLATVFGVINHGNQGDDPSIVIPGSSTDTRLLVLRYAQYFAIGPEAASVFAILPTGKVSGTIAGEPGGISSGIGDATIGAMVGVTGYPALSPEDYARYQPGFSLGVLGKVSMPTGAYDASQPINLGANRWSFRIGPSMAYSLGENFLDPALLTFELLPTVAFFTANDKPPGASRVQQSPLYTVEAHAVRALDSAWWVSADMVYIGGGETSTDGVANNNPQQSLALGASVGTNIGALYLKLTYGNTVARNDDGLFKTGARLLAVYAF